jgi:hypothetical protein
LDSCEGWNDGEPRGGKLCSLLRSAIETVNHAS